MLREAPEAAQVAPESEVVRPDVRAAIVDLERRGRLSPHDVIDAARSPESPLHHCFEWDNAAAGEAWRLEQARRLIRSVKVVVTTEETSVCVPRYVRDVAQDEDEAGYVTCEQLRKEPDNARKLLAYEFERAATHVRRAVEIAKGLDLADDVRTVAVGITNLLRRVK